MLSLCVVDGVCPIFEDNAIKKIKKKQGSRQSGQTPLFRKLEKGKSGSEPSTHDGT